MNERRVFVTGLGIISPVGSGSTETLEALRSAVSGIRPLASGLFPVTDRTVFPVGQIERVVTEGPVPRTHALALAAARQAVAEDGSLPDSVVLGGTTGGMPVTEELLRDHSPMLSRWHGTGTVADYVARELGCRGPVFTISTACSSGTLALEVALELLRAGRARRVLAGGVDALCRLTYHGFAMLQLVDPQGARPFDRRRAGMTVGEAAAMLMLTVGPVPPAGARAEILGGGASCDAHHATTPDPEGRGAQRAMERALRDAGVRPPEVDYLNLHGTGTRDNDAAEALAVRRVFGGRPPPLSSTKDTFAHSLAAAGAVEAVVCVLCLEHGLIPGTPRCQEPDPKLGVCLERSPRPARLDVALSNSFGFGGNNASVVLGRADRPARPRPASAGLRALEVRRSACLSGAGHTAATLARFLAGEPVAGVCPLEEVTRGIPPRALRRLKRLPRMALALALGEPPEGDSAGEVRSIFMGTAFGPLSETHDFLAELFLSGEQLSSPTDFVGSVHNSVAGQLAMHHGATGPNVTATGEDDAFEQAVFLAALLPREDDFPCLVLGADEAHPRMSPLVDPGAPAGGALCDGGGALWATAAGEGSRLRLTPVFLDSTPDRAELLDSLLDALGGASQLGERVGAVFVGIPAVRRAQGEEELRRWLARARFAGPVVDYRHLTGEFGTASALAAVLACRIREAGILPRALTSSGDVPLGEKRILLLGLGARVSALEVGP